MNAERRYSDPAYTVGASLAYTLISAIPCEAEPAAVWTLRSPEVTGSRECWREVVEALQTGRWLGWWQS